MCSLSYCHIIYHLQTLPEQPHSPLLKLLGLHLDANFSWRSHIEAMLSKATKRLYFLKLLKHAGVPCAQLQHFYVAVIRPISEYAAPIWHHLLTNCQSDQIEAIQKRAINIIHSPTHGMPYSNALFCQSQ